MTSKYARNFLNIVIFFIRHHATPQQVQMRSSGNDEHESVICCSLSCNNNYICVTYLCFSHCLPYKGNKARVYYLNNNHLIEWETWLTIKGIFIFIEVVLTKLQLRMPLNVISRVAWRWVNIYLIISLLMAFKVLN